MMFTEVEYAFFLPVVLLFYWIGPRRTAWQNGVLLLASYVFYCTWDVRLLPLLLALTLVDFLVGLALGAPEGAVSEGRRQLALGVSLVANLGALAWFKYVGFFAQSLNAVLARTGLELPLPVLEIALPLGISFYTLQKLGYIIDVYYGRQEPSRSLLDFALFTAFFAQITAGPISRGRQLLPQLSNARQLRPEDLASGAATFLLGFAMKAFVAEVIAQFVANPVFNDPSRYSVAGHWAGLFGYAIQVFCDFAGYSLMAIGTARLLGLELPENFRLPYLSTSMLEFWRRWHITLNTWLFDYIYTPLVTGGGYFRARFTLALLVVFLASGLWHGAALTFVVWGSWHGVGLMVNREWDEYYRRLCRRNRSWVAVRRTTLYALTAWLITQAFFLLSLILFRAPSLQAAGAYAIGLVRSTGGDLPPVVGFNPVFRVGCALLIFLALHVPAFGAGQRLVTSFRAQPAPVRGIAYAVIIVFLSLFTPVGAGAFIYRQF